MNNRCNLSDILIKFAYIMDFHYEYKDYECYERFILKKAHSIYVFTQDLREHNINFEHYLNDESVLKIIAETVCNKKYIFKSFGTVFCVLENSKVADLSLIEEGKIYFFKRRNIEQCLLYLKLINSSNCE